MKGVYFAILAAALSVVTTVQAQEFEPEKFANDYFTAWAATQSPAATQSDIEHYLAFLTEDVGHQHLPYDPDGSRSATGKADMRQGMNYYLGAHTAYKAKLVEHSYGDQVVVIKYKSSSAGIHPQTQEEIARDRVTVEVLEIDNGKVSVIRKYSR